MQKIHQIKNKILFQMIYNFLRWRSGWILFAAKWSSKIQQESLEDEKSKEHAWSFPATKYRNYYLRIIFKLRSCLGDSYHMIFITYIKTYEFYFQ